MSITISCLQLYERYAEKPTWRPSGTGLSGNDVRDVEAKLGPILAELEELRRKTVRQIDRRVLWMVPAGAALFGIYFGMEHASMFSGLFAAAIGASAGWALAFTSPNNTYRSAYKSRIVPHLAARFGDLSYRPAQEPDLKRLTGLRILPHFGKKAVEDEIFGVYRGVPLNLVELCLETGGKNSRVVFNGLLAELRPSSRFTGTTLVVREALLGNTALALGPAHGLERVRLEDPRFEALYQVYGSDQVAARALLTPAVMERLMALERGDGGDPPRLLAENGILRIALPNDPKENFFEPPSIAHPVQGGGPLLQLSADIAAVLKLIDAVLDMTPAIRRDHIAQAPGKA